MTDEIRFFLTGPTYVRRDVRAAMTQQPVAHRGTEFKALYRSLQPRLQEVFRTSGDVVVLTSSSSMAWDVATTSLIENDVLCLTNGAFSERFLVTCNAWGKTADQVGAPWGRPIDPDDVRLALRRKSYEAVTLAHNETSTGVLSDLEAIARVVREESDALILVDAVSSLAGAPVETEAWGVDYVFTGSQKALALPPGLCLVSASDRALAKAETVAHRGYYTDLLRYRDQHRKGGTITTPAEPQIWALDKQLDILLDEGLETRWQRHAELRALTESWAAERGFTYASTGPDGTSPTVSCLRPPAGFAAPDLVRALAERGFVVAGGYGAWKAETFRIGHMGEVRVEHLEALFETIDAIVSGS